MPQAQVNHVLTRLFCTQPLWFQR